MNILFLTLSYPEGENASNIYIDLMTELKDKENTVYVVTSLERRNKRKTFIEKQRDINILRVKTGNIQKTNILEKGISTLLIEYQFMHAINKYFTNVKFDLILYSTPPITFEKIIKMIKKRDNAKSYLLLKDIFPQNAVDIGMIKKDSILHKIFSKKERKLYCISDYIGCMSHKNKQYLLEHNRYIDENIVEVCPNSIKPSNLNYLSQEEKIKLREELKIPKDSIIFIYGGNLGKPQGIDFLIDIIREYKNREDVFFLIVGSGTEYKKLEDFIVKEEYINTRLYSLLPKSQYDNYVKLSDVGLILLDKRFTIPNFPSRLLGYMDYGLPVVAATDINTDIGEVIVNGEFGYWCESTDLKAFNEIVDNLLKDKSKIRDMGINSRNYLIKNYTAEKSADVIMNAIKKSKNID
ncbi:MAG: glycosyltransferase family 4 protein [Clostridium sp.]|uniref:glycosyltransferase family 4 protein n=1 Tax=Clostridium sp. TaxID=1506 RepID=UPI0025FFE312|nr:glycosyltransferase family 4 protein [Clostridium sp.]MCI6693181.1 glycosyltransferase family 4 protein [Clostridium sp.]MDY4252016.1 glycosyltransferase family 4 protein [Clostridium sp.]MDY6229133.1 glycosyltransferase family 4 protein [Clostridium sp.]